MEVVDLKLVLLGQPGVGKTCLVRADYARSRRGAVSSHPAVAGSRRTPPSRCERERREELPFASPLPYAFTGPPQVYRYLYNTFGETISVRAPAQNAPRSDWQPHRPCRRQRSSDHRRVLCDEED